MAVAGAAVPDVSELKMFMLFPRWKETKCYLDAPMNNILLDDGMRCVHRKLKQSVVEYATVAGAIVRCSSLKSSPIRRVRSVAL